MRNEIGSEFCVSEPVGTYTAKDERVCAERWVLSGRTALDEIARDLIAQKGLPLRIALPEYCCESMVTPFTANGFSISWYSVQADAQIGFRVNVDAALAVDAILLIEYFGFEDATLPAVARKAREKGVAVIYDATHKLNGNVQMEPHWDYCFCSFRKWMYANAAVLIKKGPFCCEEQKKNSTQYCELRSRAAAQKEAYLLGQSGEKEGYLALFRQAEEQLERNYRFCGAEPSSVKAICECDWERIITARRENAAYLIEGLSCMEAEWIRLPETSLQNSDCPLFLPVLIVPEYRDTVRRALIQDEIYCPVHWPVPQQLTSASARNLLYISELSLVCDQRYTATDMDRILQVLQRVGRKIDNDKW